MHVVAIIAAGGYGHRVKVGVPKQLLEIGGLSILERSIRPFESSDRVDEIVVVLPPELVKDFPPCIDVLKTPVHVVPGGRSRQDSVACGFDHIQNRADVVVVHDAARPFVTEALIARTIDAALESGAAIAALPAQDTVKQRDMQKSTAVVKTTFARETIYLAQTPQAFRVGVLRDAVSLGQQGLEATDEAALAESAGHPVRLIEGEARNMKITTAADLAIARGFFVDDQIEKPVRVGIGYDVHRVVTGRPLILGGIRIPWDRGLEGHSDADTVCHAAIDAILGAASAGNIGEHFSDTDPRWKGISSIELLWTVTGIVRDRGFTIENLDVTLVAEQPSVGAYIMRMRTELSRAMSIGVSSVSVKGKTNDGVGSLGRGEAIAAHAITLLRWVGTTDNP